MVGLEAEKGQECYQRMERTKSKLMKEVICQECGCHYQESEGFNAYYCSWDCCNMDQWLTIEREGEEEVRAILESRQATPAFPEPESTSPIEAKLNAIESQLARIVARLEDPKQ